MAARKQITGAVEMGGLVYRAGQEKELEAAAEKAGISLGDERFKESVRGFGSAAADDGEDEPEAAPAAAKKSARGR